MSKNGYKFEIYSRIGIRGRRWYFRMKAPNGEIIAHSEAYNRIESAQKAVTLIKRKAASARTEVL